MLVVKEFVKRRTKIEKTALGATGIEISRIGFGAWAAGSDKWRHGWSGQTDADSIGAIERALELGINWIDTAAAYGAGHSETIVGRAIAGIEPRPLLFTKCGALVGGEGVSFSLQPDSIRRELEGSLRRLGVDAVDLYQIHRPQPDADIELGWQTLLELRDEGLVRCVGVSNFSVAQLGRLAAVGPVQTLQPPYSLMQPQAADELLPYAQRNRIGVIAYSPLGSGLLTGTMDAARLASLPEHDWRRNDDRFSPAALTRSAALAPRLRRIGERHETSPGAVAIAWVLAHEAIDGAIVGFRTARQVEELASSARLHLCADDLELLGRPQ